MAQYRVYLLNDADQIFDWVPVECDNDEGAVTLNPAIGATFSLAAPMMFNRGLAFMPG